MTTRWCIIIIALIVLISCCDVGSVLTPVVSTTHGKIRGSSDIALGKPLDKFLGIPFAKPPVGDLRFKRPETADAWSGEYEALTLPLSCPQIKEELLELFENQVYSLLEDGDPSEDCLYLNIWAPRNARGLPVMVWIHGGAFVMGTTSVSLYDGSYLAATQQVIVVSIQYRLSLFGFMYLGTEDAPGNMGLLDQHLALKWVHENIQAFGGDPTHVTIFGESAGGMSVMLHALSDRPKYFSHVIAQSAPDFDMFGYSAPDTAMQTYLNYSDTLDCGRENVPSIIQCLRHQDPHVMLEKLGPTPHWVTIDGFFLKRAPKDLWSSVEGLDFIIGMTAEEGYALVTVLFNGEDKRPRPTADDEKYLEVLKTTLGIEDEDYVKRLDAMYARNNFDNIDKAGTIFGDALMLCAGDKMAADLAAKNNVYLYRLVHRSSMCFWPDWMKCGHGCDLDLVFGSPLGGHSNLYTQQEKDLSSTIQHMWGNFAKTGNPNGDAGSVWRRYTSDYHAYLDLDEPELASGVNLKEDECQLLEERKSMWTEKPKEEL